MKLFPIIDNKPKLHPDTSSYFEDSIKESIFDEIYFRWLLLEIKSFDYTLIKNINN